MRSLTRLAAQRRRWFGRIALAILVSALLVTIFVLTLIDTRLSLSSAVRWGLWIGLLGVALLWLIREQWRTSKRYTAMEAARAIESRTDIGQQLRTALEVAAATPGGSAGGSHGFGERLVAESEKWLGGYDWRALVPRGVAGRWLALTAAIAATLLACAAIRPEFGLGMRRILLPGTATTYTRVAWENPPEWFDQRHLPLVRVKVTGREAVPKLFVREEGAGDWETIDLSPRDNSPVWDAVLSGREKSLAVYAVAGDGRTESLDLRFEPIPELRETRVSLVYPDYLGRENETRSGGDVRALEGTQVAWTFVFNTAPAQVAWSVTGEGHPQELEPAETCVTAVHELKAGTRNPTLTITDRRGRAVDSWRYEAVGLVDALPTIEILEPARNRDATSITELPVRIRARDDHGLGEIGVVLEAAGETRWLLEKVFDSSNQRRANEMVTAMLETVPLDITDNVRLYAYALDRKPRGGPRALSHFRSIDIRQFKLRWLFRTAPPGGGNAPKMEDIVGLEKIIERQREIVSEVFVLKGGGRDSLSQALFEKCAGEAAREEALSLDAGKLASLWEEVGRLEMDDIVLLQVAGDQMVEAAEELRVPNRDEAFEIADGSLSNLLRLRKKLLNMIIKGGGGEMDPKEQPPQLMTLAEEARRLAREEADVRSQIVDPEIAASTRPELTRRQQEVAIFDAGELYSNLLTHPEKTEGALALMDEAETFMTEAGRKMDSADAEGAVPDLALAEQRLLELAEFLTTLELEMISAALDELAEQAEKEAEKLARSQSQSQSQSGGSSGSESEGVPEEGDEGEESGDSESDQSSEVAGNEAEGSEARDGENSASGETGEAGEDPGATESAAGPDGESGDERGSGQEPGSDGDSGADGSVPDAIAQAARRARLTDEILKALAERAQQRSQAGKDAGQGQGEKDDRAGNSGGENSDEGDTPGSKGGEAEEGGRGDGDSGDGDGENGGEKSDEGDTPGGKGGEAEEGTQGDGDSGDGDGKNGGENRGDENTEAGDGTGDGDGERGVGDGGSRGRALANLRKELGLGKLAERLEALAAEGRGGGSGAGAGAGAGEPAPEDLAALLRGAGGRMRELARELDASQLAQLAELKSEAEELKQQIESEDGEEGEGDGANPFAAAAVEEDNPFTAPNGAGNASQEDPIGGPGMPGADPEPGLGPGAEEFANRLERLEDETARTWGGYLRDVPFDRNLIPILDAIGQRLDELMAEIPQASGVAGGRRTVPEENRREIEDYFRNLSEDFGEETWIKR